MAAGFGGWISAEALKDEAIEGWREKNPPPPWVWKWAAEARGLREVTADPALRAWYRRMPRDSSPRSVWWDSASRALWILPAESESPEIRVFSASPRPPSSLSPALALLGRGWEALDVWQKQAIGTGSPSRARVSEARRDPRLWNF